MNATERVALQQGVEIYDEMTGAVDERTLADPGSSSATATVKRRGLARSPNALACRCRRTVDRVLACRVLVRARWEAVDMST